MTCRQHLEGRELWHTLAASAGAFALPFSLGYVTYFNARIVPIAYALAAVALSRLKLGAGSASVVVVGATLLCAAEVPRHAIISDEFASLKPLLERMEPNARVLPHEATQRFCYRCFSLYRLRYLCHCL